MTTPPGRISQVVNDGLRLDVRDEGPLTGDPVVLLHGFPQRASSWDQVTPLLHEAELRTLALDQRGYSPGARPRSRRSYRVGRIVGDLTALLDAVGRPVHLVGHDWGAAVGWAAAARFPDRVRTLTAVSVPHPAAMVAAGLRGGQLRRSWYMLAFQLPWLPERVLAGPAGERFLRHSGMRPAELARYRREIVADGALPGGLGWYRAMPLSRSWRSPGSRVRIPTTMVWSEGDVAIGRAAARGAERHVDGPYAWVELPGVSHWVPEHAPHELAAAILDRVAGSATMEP